MNIRQNHAVLSTLKAIYHDWSGDDESLTAIKRLLVLNQSDDHFPDTLRQFKEHIQRHNSAHYARYQRVRIIYSIYRNIETESYHKLNKLIDSFIYQPRIPLLQLFKNTGIQIAKISIEVIVRIGKFAIDNPGKFTLLVLGVSAAANSVSAQTNKNTQMTSDTLRPCDNTHHQVNNAFAQQQSTNHYYDHFITQTNLICLAAAQDLELKKLIFNKLMLDTKYAKQLSPIAAKEQCEKLFTNIKGAMQDPDADDSVKRVFNSVEFRTIIVENFPEQEGAAGLYKETENSLYVLKSDALPGNEDIATFKHELHHADMTNIRTKNNPIQFLSEESHKHVKTNYPFVNSREKQRLDRAISKGNKLITEEFSRHNELALIQKLSNPSDIHRYEKLKATLQDYKPALWGRMVQQDEASLASIQANLDEGFPVKIGNLYVNNAKQMTDGIAVYGHHIHDMTDSDQIAYAFIMDTHRRTHTLPIMYKNVLEEGENLEDVVTTETDAKIYELPYITRKTFYPDVIAYHQYFKKQHLNDQQPVQNNNNRPF